VNIVKEIRSYYENNNLTYGKGHPKNLWIEASRQTVRFAKFIELFSFSGKTIYDVGCGYGDFYFYLLENGVSFKEYIGIDLLKDHCDVAKERLPSEVNVQCGNFLDYEPQKCDVFVLSGTLNFYKEGWLDFALKVVEKMWLFANKAILFNMRSNFDGKNYKHIKPSFWCSYAEQKTNKFLVNHDYLENDFTIAMFKKGNERYE
jgi:SAM-dependent methyltransferase